MPDEADHSFRPQPAKNNPHSQPLRLDDTREESLCYISIVRIHRCDSSSLSHTCLSLRQVQGEDSGYVLVFLVLK